MDHLEKIKNSYLLDEIYGGFPSFHDAEILQIILNAGTEFEGPSLESVIYAFDITSNIGENGSYVLQNENDITFKFHDVCNAKIDFVHFYNELSGLRIIDLSARQMENVLFEVHFDGPDISFQCRSISVERIAPHK